MNTIARKKYRYTKAFLKLLLHPTVRSKIPVNFVAEEYMATLPNGVNKKYARDAFFYILSRIINKNEVFGYDLTTKHCNPVSINKTVLKNLFGNAYIHYVKKLVDSMVIIQHGKYRPKIQSSTYYLGEKFRYQQWIHQPYSPATTTRIRKRFTQNAPQKEKILLKYTHILYWLTTKGLTIDAASAISYMHSLEKVYYNKLLAGNKVEALDIHTRSSALKEQQINNIIQKINKSNHFARIDKNNRLYTIFSSMPEPLRYFLKYNGETLVAVDISNSQPFHFCYLFNKEFWSAQPTACSLISIHPGLYEHFSKKDQLGGILKMIRQCKNKTDVSTYLKATKEGSFYESLVNQYGAHYTSLNSKEKAKTEFVTYLNFDIRKKTSGRYGAYRQFEQDYPNVVELMELIKKYNHTDMSTILQRLEAKLFLIITGREFSRQYPDVPIFTIHDTIITIQSHTDKLENIIKTSYERNLGFCPKVKTTVLTPETAELNMEKYAQKKYSKLHPNG